MGDGIQKGQGMTLYKYVMYCEMCHNYKPFYKEKMPFCAKCYADLMEGWPE
jgi:hypothetical protein